MFLAIGISLASCSAAPAQDAALPDAPDAAQQANPAPTPPPGGDKDDIPASKNGEQAKQTKRILYIVPNFRAVSTDEKLPPQTVKQKFQTAALDSVDYSAFVFVAILAGVYQLENSTPQFQHGAAAYGRYYWHTYADWTDENLWVEFILPVALRQDSRYYTMGRGGFAKRFKYSLSRVIITRTDSGREAFNASEVFGSGIAAGISSTYYPRQQRSFGNTATIWITSLGIDAGSDLFKEFWPELNRKIFHQKQ